MPHCSSVVSRPHVGFGPLPEQFSNPHLGSAHACQSGPPPTPSDLSVPHAVRDSRYRPLTVLARSAQPVFLKCLPGEHLPRTNRARPPSLRVPWPNLHRGAVPNGQSTSGLMLGMLGFHAKPQTTIHTTASCNGVALPVGLCAPQSVPMVTSMREAGPLLDFWPRIGLFNASRRAGACPWSARPCRGLLSIHLSPMLPHVTPPRPLCGNRRLSPHHGPPGRRSVSYTHLRAHET